MSVCTKTGLSKDQQERWSYLYSYMDGEIDAPDLSSLENQYIEQLDAELITLLNQVGGGDSKTRDRLASRLEKILSRRFNNNVTVETFGSSKTGFSLNSGDLDICLSFNKKTPSRVMDKISRLLFEEGMNDIRSIPNASVPIVKFSDPRSGLDVDISLDNRLAIYNSDMLKSYAQEHRLQQFVQMVKYWASRRDINDAFKGTLSSYAWTLLAIQHAQMIQPPLAPNRQIDFQSKPVSFQGTMYDVGFNNDEFKTKNKQSLASLLLSFFDRYATRWDWESMVVSIRNGQPLSTREKKWEHKGPLPLEVVTGADKGKMEHIMPIEDPFNHEHDLSRVVRAEGAMSIQNEFMRAIEMFSEGKTWEEICEKVVEDKSKTEDIFQDLRQLSPDEINTRLDEKRNQLEEVMELISQLLEEKEIMNDIIELLTDGFKETNSLRAEEKKIFSELETLNVEIRELKNKREETDARIVLPTNRIRQELEKIFLLLTQETDVFDMQTLYQEKKSFSYFFELQEMYKQSRDSDKANKKHIKLRRKHFAEYTSLKEIKGVKNDILQDLIQSHPDLEGIEPHPGSLREYKRNAKKLQNSINKQFNRKFELRREIKRVEGWQRISSRKQNNLNRREETRNQRSRTTQKPEVNINEVRQKASSGDSISLNELDALLAKGGIASIGNNEPKASQQKQRQSKKRPSRRIDIRQGRTRGRKETRK